MPHLKIDFHQHLKNIYDIYQYGELYIDVPRCVDRVLATSLNDGSLSLSRRYFYLNRSRAFFSIVVEAVAECAQYCSAKPEKRVTADLEERREVVASKKCNERDVPLLCLSACGRD